MFTRPILGAKNGILQSCYDCPLAEDPWPLLPIGRNLAIRGSVTDRTGSGVEIVSKNSPVAKTDDVGPLAEGAWRLLSIGRNLAIRGSVADRT